MKFFLQEIILVLKIIFLYGNPIDLFDTNNNDPKPNDSSPSARKFNRTSKNQTLNSRLQIYFIKLVDLEKSTSTKTSQPKPVCQNPDVEYLDLVLSDFYSFYRKHEQNTYKKAIKQNEVETFKSSTLKQMLDNLLDKSQCGNDRNKTSLNQQSLCPWKYIVTYRTQKYPHYKTEVKCTCDSCSIGYKSRYKCMPVLKITPVLENTGECGHDGFYKWKPASEYVNVACVCAEAHRIIPHM